MQSSHGSGKLPFEPISFQTMTATVKLQINILSVLDLKLFYPSHKLSTSLEGACLHHQMEHH